MPDREPPMEHAAGGHSARLLRVLIWAGVSLAPLAAVVVLLGGSDAAQPMLKKAAADLEAQLGATHPETLRAKAALKLPAA